MAKSKKSRMVLTHFRNLGAITKNLQGKDLSQVQETVIFKGKNQSSSSNNTITQSSTTIWPMISRCASIWKLRLIFKSQNFYRKFMHIKKRTWIQLKSKPQQSFSQQIVKQKLSKLFSLIKINYRSLMF